MHQYTTPSFSQTIWPRWASRQFLSLPIVETLLPVTFGYSLSSRKNLEAVVMSSRRRLIRRGLEFHMCTINKSAHTKKVTEGTSYHKKTFGWLKIRRHSLHVIYDKKAIWWLKLGVVHYMNSFITQSYTSPVSWGGDTHRLHLFRRVRFLQRVFWIWHGKALVLELCGRWITPSCHYSLVYSDLEW